MARATPERSYDVSSVGRAVAAPTLAQILIRAKRLAREVVAEEAEECDKKARWPEKSFRAIQEAGFGGLVVPEEHGGWGQGLEALVKVCEIFGRESASFAISYGMHCVGTAVLCAKATPEQVEEYVRPIARGEHITTLALSEPGTGVHFYYPETRLERLNDGFVVRGTKSFATNGGHADSYVVSTMATAPGMGPGIFSCVLVPGSSQGLRWDKPYDGFGMRGNSARTFHLDDVRLDKQALLGEEGDQLWYVFHIVAPYFLAAMAGTYQGIADRALDEAAHHLRRRFYNHTNKTASDADVMQFKLGHLWSMVERTRCFVHWAAQEGDSGGAKALPALCSAKAEVADCATNAANEAMTLMGGTTYRDGSLLPRLLRDARAAHVMAPTTDMLRTWAGRAVLGIPILGE